LLTSCCHSVLTTAEECQPIEAKLLEFIHNPLRVVVSPFAARTRRYAAAFSRMLTCTRIAGVPNVLYPGSRITTRPDVAGIAIPLRNSQVTQIQPL